MRLPLPIRLPAALLGALLLVPSGARAADGEGTKLDLSGGADAPGAAASGGGGGALLRTIVGLLVVLAIIYAITWVLRQVKASRESGAAGSGLTTLATLPLGSDRAVHLVRAGEEVVLIGSGSQGVTHLRTYGLDEARRLGLLEPEAAGLPGTRPAGGPGASHRRLLDAIRDRTVLR